MGDSMGIVGKNRVSSESAVAPTVTHNAVEARAGQGNGKRNPKSSEKIVGSFVKEENTRKASKSCHKFSQEERNTARASNELK